MGVGHPVESLSEVRSPDPRSAQICRPDGISRSFQVKRNSIEPRKASWTRNLLAKDDCRLTDVDEMEETRPEMPLVSSPFSFACLAERLARTAAGPNVMVVCPTCQPEGVTPAADAGEEMTLLVSDEINGSDVFNGSVIYISVRDHARFDQFPKPCGGFGVVLVVVDTHAILCHVIRDQ